jgi:hypothetical protein
MKIKIIMLTSSAMLLCGVVWYGLGAHAPTRDNRISSDGLPSTAKKAAVDVPASVSESLVLPRAATTAKTTPTAKTAETASTAQTASENVDDSSVTEIPAAWSLIDPLVDQLESSASVPYNALENTAYVINLDPQVMDQAQLSLSLPNGQLLTMARQKVEQMPSGSRSWIGKDPQQPELFAVLTQNGNTVAGNIQTQDGATYLITTLVDGRQVVYQQDDKKLNEMSRHDDRVLPLEIAMMAADKVSASARARPVIPNALKDDAKKSDIRVLFVFTRAAINVNGFKTLQAQVDNEVVIANNMSFPSSGVNMRITPVGPVDQAGKVSAVTYAYAEGNSFAATLKDLSLGQKLNIETLRTQYGADLVQGVIAQNSYCGLGWQLPHTVDVNSKKRYGYSVISHSCISNSMLHELGHNMGLDHDVGNSTVTIGMNHGYRNCFSSGFRTIMAYPCMGVNVPKVKLFSNPNITYRGLPVGQAGVANNAYILETFGRHSASMFR